MSDKLELVTQLERVPHYNTTADREIRRAIDSLEHGDPQDINDTLWDTILGCDTESARAIQRNIQDINELAHKVTEQATLDHFQAG